MTDTTFISVMKRTDVNMGLGSVVHGNMVSVSHNASL